MVEPEGRQSEVEEACHAMEVSLDLLCKNIEELETRLIKVRRRNDVLGMKDGSPPKVLVPLAETLDRHASIIQAQAQKIGVILQELEL